MWHKNQRVISDSEKELGLGSVQELDINRQTVTVDFPLTEESRTYSLKNAPIRRFLLKKGQFFLNDAKEQTVQQISYSEDLAQYHCQDGEIVWEYELPYDLVEGLSTLERVTQNLSPLKAYDLRQDALKLKKLLSLDRLSGLVTSRVNLLPHQIYLANQISGEENPRVLLADEVGLGKTIEAGLIYSALKVLGKAERVLIITPSSLIHQWAQEMAESFSTLFTVLDKARFQDEAKGQDLSPFEVNPKIIISIDELTKNPEKAEQAKNAHWDLVIVDEAHHLEWDPDAPSLSWEIINQISSQSKGLLLLTATPRQRGLATQYGLLHMIDPKKFSSFEDFIIEMEILDQIAYCAREISETKTISKEVQEQLELFFKGDEELTKILKEQDKIDSEDILSKLLDRYGTGRLIYRNRKCNLNFFPKRNVIFEGLNSTKAYDEKLKSLDPEELSQRTLIDFATGRKGEQLEEGESTSTDPRISWLANYIKTTKGKTFVICSSQKRVLEVGEELQKQLNLTDAKAKKLMTLFHEGKSSFIRDQEAALFAQDDHPTRILIASELGGEGRNFQFLKKMVLLDLPGTPEALEQRIGRLDRIGQGKSIDIHIPFLKDSPEEVLLNWYHKGLNAFASQNPSNGVILENFAEDILDTLTYFFPKSKSYLEKNKKLDELILKTKKEQKEICEELEKTQDILLDLNSFNEEKTKKLVKSIEKHEDSPHLESFVLDSLDFLGIDYEEHDKKGSIKLQSDSMSFVSDLGLFNEIQDKVLTFDRKVYLTQKASYFISYPTKFVQNLVEIATSEDQGRFSFCSMTDSTNQKKVFFQILFSLQAKGPKYLELETHLQPESLEYLIDSKGVKRSEVIEQDKLEQIKKESPYQAMIKSQKFIDILTKTLDNLEEESQEWKNKILKKAKRNLSTKQNKKISHLNYLIKVNPMYSDKDLAFHNQKFDEIKKCLEDSKVCLESIRIILVNP